MKASGFRGFGFRVSGFVGSWPKVSGFQGFGVESESQGTGLNGSRALGAVWARRRSTHQRCSDASL